MTLTSTRSEGAILAQFRKANPFIWDQLRVTLSNHGFEKFGSGMASSDQGQATPVFSGIAKKNSVMYFPELKQFSVRSDVPADASNLMERLLPDLKSLILPQTAWESNFAFVEADMRWEAAPATRTPVEIMRRLTPGPMVHPYEGVFSGGPPVMFTHRVAHWEGSIDTDIRQVIPWVEATFMPMIENPDRFFCQIICRHKEMAYVRKTAQELHDRMFEFIGQCDSGA